MAYNQNGWQFSNAKYNIHFFTLKIDKYTYNENTFDVWYFQWFVSRGSYKPVYIEKRHK